MTPQDPATPPPSLSAGGAATPPPSGGPPPPPLGSAGRPSEDEDAPLKPTLGQKLVKNKYLVAGLLAALFFGGIGLWYFSLTKELATAAPPSPVASELGTLTTAPKPGDVGDPVSNTEQSLNRDQQQETAPEAGVMLADGSASAPADKPVTAAQRKDFNGQMVLTARANNTDSLTVTTRDKTTGRFTEKRVPVQRVAVSTGSRRGGGSAPGRANYYTGPTNGGFSGVTPGNQQAPPPEKPRPRYDTDGVPFETNDEINMMIAGLPEEVKATYEKMSGRRFRPLLPSTAGAAQNAVRDQRSAMAYVPGMDGFNTIRFRGSNSTEQTEEEGSIPDVFYRCSIQGNQEVKSGSVVLLRLNEDATFAGVTFPRNMLFSALANVDVNRVTLAIDRLGPHRVSVQTYNYAYMPGIMIDPGKRAPAPGGNSLSGIFQQSGTQELSNAIAQSQQAANSLIGVAGRMGVTLLARVPRAGSKLRTVSLPDGYPMLLSRANGSAAAGAVRQAGSLTPGGIMGQEGNPFQSLLMSGQGQGGYQGNQGVVPPLYSPQQSQQPQQPRNR